MIRRRQSSPSSGLSEEMRTVLLKRPWAVGKLLTDLPPHDDLRRLWRAQEAELRSALQRGQRAWFEERDWFDVSARKDH